MARRVLSPQDTDAARELALQYQPRMEGRVSLDAGHCYFDNDIKVHAPYDAQRLIAAVEGLRNG